MDKRREDQKTPQNTDSPILFFFFNIETICHPDIATVLRTFSSFCYKQWKNTGTESDIASDINHKNGTS